jgi:hypothetical protein
VCGRTAVAAVPRYGEWHWPGIQGSLALPAYLKKKVRCCQWRPAWPQPLAQHLRRADFTTVSGPLLLLLLAAMFVCCCDMVFDYHKS